MSSDLIKVECGTASRKNADRPEGFGETGSSEAHLQPLRTEAEIMSSWCGARSPVVSICCAAFNHESYIEDALRGFLAQRTSFPFEVLVHDDASTDGTCKIIKAYHRRFPSIVKPILQDENQYSKGRKITSGIIFAAAAGDFLAICEGDDYWTDVSKLEKQVAALREHEQCHLCFHPALRIDQATGKSLAIGVYGAMDSVLPAHQIVLRRSGLIPTASMMITKKASKRVQSFLAFDTQAPVGDVFIQFISASFGGAIFLSDSMSVYRLRVPGSWTSSHLDREFRLEHSVKMASSLQSLDVFLGGAYSQQVHFLIRRYITIALREPGGATQKKSQLLSRFRHCFGIADRLLLRAFIVSPMFLKACLAIAFLRRRLKRSVCQFSCVAR